MIHPDTDADLAVLIEEAAEEGRRMFERMCPTCGRRFVPRRSHGVYCKTSCRVLAWERRRLADVDVHAEEDERPDQYGDHRL